MEPEKTLQLSVPQTMAEQMEKTAGAEGISLSELLCEAFDIYFPALNTPEGHPGWNGPSLRRLRERRHEWQQGAHSPQQTSSTAA